MVDNPMEYLVDNAPKIQEALALDFSMRNEIFMPFPRIDMAWPKHNLFTYHYDVGAALSEYWYDGEWE